MTAMTASRPGTTDFCSVLARQRGLDPIGYAPPFDYRLFVETPLPWPRDAVQQDRRLPPEVRALRQQLILDRPPDRRIKLGLTLLAPHASTPDGLRRVIFLRRPSLPAGDVLALADAAAAGAGAPPVAAPPFSTFLREEYLVPEAELGRLCWALLRDPAALPAFQRRRLPSQSSRELLVCTHGAVDAACARFGGPLERRLGQLAAAAGGRLRAWRCSHFGGHVFAPTVLELPDCRYWAYVEEDVVAEIAERRGDHTRLYDRYRGWSGHRSVWARVAEREALMAHGWPWFDYEQASLVVAEGERPPAADGHEAEATWGEVRLDWRDPATGRRGAYRARVEQTPPVATPHTTGHIEAYPYHQYRVAWCQPVAAE